MARRLVVLLTVVAVAGLTLTGPVGAGDADGDGRDELAISIPNQRVAGQEAAGAIVVLPGGGVSGAKAYSSATPSVAGAAESEDHFGVSLAWGDFNCDGRADLAIGAPGESTGSKHLNGAVTVLYASTSGLRATGSRSLTEHVGGIAGAAESFDSWGSEVATGDVNGDGCDDLVVAAESEDVGAVPDAGAITVVLGSSPEMTGAGSRQISRASAGVPGVPVAGALLGQRGSIALSDLDGDGFDEIVLGDPLDESAGYAGGGALLILPGSSTGVALGETKLLTQDSPGVAGVASDSLFGASVAAGDFNDDGYGDLAVGAPEGTVGSAWSAGTLVILPGSAAGVGGPGSVELSEDTPGVPGVSERDDAMGRGRSGVGDFNGDGYDDVAASVPGQSVSGQGYAGSVLVFYGSTTGVLAAGSQSIHANSPGVAGVAEPGDALGWWGMSGLHLRAGVYDDLVIGVPFESVGSIQGAGAVLILRGSSTGLTGSGSVQYWEGTAGMPGTVDYEDWFGFAAR